MSTAERGAAAALEPQHLRSCPTSVHTVPALSDRRPMRRPADPPSTAQLSRTAGRPAEIRWSARRLVDSAVLRWVQHVHAVSTRGPSPRSTRRDPGRTPPTAPTEMSINRLARGVCHREQFYFVCSTSYYRLLYVFHTAESGTLPERCPYGVRGRREIQIEGSVYGFKLRCSSPNEMHHR